MSAVEWGSLPVRGSGFEEAVEELQARPGEWARIRGASGLWSSDAYRRRDRLRARGCEAEVRRSDDRTRRDVWARWPA